MALSKELSWKLYDKMFNSFSFTNHNKNTTNQWVIDMNIAPSALNLTLHLDISSSKAAFEIAESHNRIDSLMQLFAENCGLVIIVGISSIENIYYEVSNRITGIERDLKPNSAQSTSFSPSMNWAYNELNMKIA